MFAKHLTALALAAALLAPAALAAGEPEYGLPRAMPSDYAAAGLAEEEGLRQHGLPRPTPAEYAASLTSDGEERSTVIEWPSVGLGAGFAFAAVALGAALVRLVRTASHA